MAKKSAVSLRFEPLAREQFVSVSLTLPADAFAKTFRAKADAFELWQHGVGAWSGDDQLLGAIILRCGMRKPQTANLELLHTFAAHRHHGVAAQLVDYAYKGIGGRAQYFRVSSEPSAVGFYRKIGLKFWGEQKSGCSLCIHRITNASIADGAYDYNDPVIRSMLFTGRKGGLVRAFARVA